MGYGVWGKPLLANGLWFVGGWAWNLHRVLGMKWGVKRCGNRGFVGEVRRGVIQNEARSLCNRFAPARVRFFAALRNAVLVTQERDPTIDGGQDDKEGNRRFFQQLYSPLLSRGSVTLPLMGSAAVVCLVFGLVFVTGPAVAEPSLEVFPEVGKARPGKAYRIVYEVSWEGDPGDYAICPAEADAIDRGTVAVREARSFVRDGRNVVSQTVEIIPDEPGDYETPEIRIAYLHPEATSPAEAAAPGTVPSDPGVPPSLRADPSCMQVRPSRTLAWVFGGLGVSLLLLSLGWWSAWRLRRPQPQPQTAAAMDWPAVQEALHAARRHRLDGRFYEFYLALGRAAGLVEEVDVSAVEDRDSPVSRSRLGQALFSRAEEVGYRGVRPTDDEMDSDLRAVERALAREKEELEA